MPSPLPGVLVAERCRSCTPYICWRNTSFDAILHRSAVAARRAGGRTRGRRADGVPANPEVIGETLHLMPFSAPLCSRCRRVGGVPTVSCKTVHFLSFVVEKHLKMFRTEAVPRLAAVAARRAGGQARGRRADGVPRRLRRRQHRGEPAARCVRHAATGGAPVFRTV